MVSSFSAAFRNLLVVLLHAFHLLCNRYKTFKNFTEVDTAALAAEHARHASWRVRGQLQYLIERPLWGKADAIRAVLRNAAAELQRAERLIGGEDVGEEHMYKQTAEHAALEAKAAGKAKKRGAGNKEEEEEEEASSKQPRI